MTTRRRGGGRGAPAGVAPVYEGPEVLTTLLERAGSPHDAEAVAAAFTRAHKKGQPRSAVIPALFPEEPRFDGPDGARRLYSNLFGLWARIAAGLGPHDDAPALAEEPAPPTLPERGSITGDTVPGDVVEAVWKHLAALSPRELQRRRDRFENVQSDLVAWLEATPLPRSGTAAAFDLAFEAWAMLDQAFGERLDAVVHAHLRELEKEPPVLEDTQPAIAAYVAEQLDNLEEDDPAFGAAERAQVEKVLASIASALTDAVRQPS
jgi:hypothetical protein